jgi:Protein of unknown function (DUF2510)
MGVIQLRCKVFPGAFLLYLCKPRVAVDNTYEQLLRWGENTLEVPPGQHYLRVWYNYITGPTNVAEIVLDVPDGYPVRVVYKTRWLVFLPGKLEIETPIAQPALPYSGATPNSLPHGQPAQVPAQAPAQPATQAPASWNPDPTGRHEHRWWDGQRWTSAVADRGVTTDDPL